MTTANLPDQFSTVPGFIAKTWPHELDLLPQGDPLTAYRDTEAKLREASATLGMAVRDVECESAALSVTVPSFDVRLLRVMLPLL